MESYFPTTPKAPRRDATDRGWYDDPFSPSLKRYWDGSDWTYQTRPRDEPAPTQQMPRQPAQKEQFGRGRRARDSRGKYVGHTIRRFLKTPIDHNRPYDDPGWYPDPWGERVEIPWFDGPLVTSSRDRWFDGWDWTEQTQAPRAMHLRKPYANRSEKIFRAVMHSETTRPGFSPGATAVTDVSPSRRGGGAQGVRRPDPPHMFRP